jgi:O-antigen ligase
LPDEERAALESLGEHAATIHMDAFIVFLLAVWMLRCRGQLRWSMLVLAPPIVWAYVLSQRRAAMIALAVGFIVLMIVVYFRRRRVFWFATPVVVVVAIGYLAATWNARGALGLPALATKTVLFPGQLPAAEQGSDAYREIEAYNLWFTIRANRLFGVGFGNKFLQPIPLPDISFFEFWEYMPHNSVLWVWLKTGFFGFASLIFMFARAIQRGARSALLVRSDAQAAIVIAAVSYVAMFFVFAYVDIAWDVRSTVFLGFCFALCSDFEAAVDEDRVRIEHVHSHQLASVR